jgi:hypothetical protein
METDRPFVCFSEWPYILMSQNQCAEAWICGHRALKAPSTGRQRDSAAHGQSIFAAI